MRFKYIEPFEIGEGFFGRSGEKEVYWDKPLLQEIKRALFRKLGRYPAMQYFFAPDPYVDSYLTSTEKIVEHVKSDIEEEAKYEIFIPFIEFLEENAGRGGFFVFFGD